MDVDGGSADTLLVCPRDGVETRLQCSNCRTPICPACFVRTPVGLRCQTCAADAVPVVPVADGGPRWPVVAAIAVVVALVVAVGGWAATRGGGSSDGDAGVGEGAVRKIDPVTIGTGELANGASWTLVARREGTICVTFTVSSVPPRPEQCQRPPGNRVVSWVSRRSVPGPGGTTYVTMGLVSDRVERITVAPEGALNSWEVPTIGADAGLGGRFFVFDSTNGALDLTALGPNGNHLGRFPVSEIRPPPR